MCPGAEARVLCSVLGQIYGATDCGTVISMGILTNYGFDCDSDLSMLTISFPNGLRALGFPPVSNIIFCQVAYNAAVGPLTGACGREPPRRRVPAHLRGVHRWPAAAATATAAHEARLRRRVRGVEHVRRRGMRWSRDAGPP